MSMYTFQWLQLQITCREKDQNIPGIWLHCIRASRQVFDFPHHLTHDTVTTENNSTTVIHDSTLWERQKKYVTEIKCKSPRQQIHTDNTRTNFYRILCPVHTTTFNTNIYKHYFIILLFCAIHTINIFVLMVGCCWVGGWIKSLMFAGDINYSKLYYGHRSHLNVLLHAKFCSENNQPAGHTAGDTVVLPHVLRQFDCCTGSTEDDAAAYNIIQLRDDYVDFTWSAHVQIEKKNSVTER